MKNSIYPCLWFDGQAKAAADFYCSVFKDSKITSESTMVVTFELLGQKYMGLNGGPEFKANEAVSFVIECKDQQEIDYYWDKLISGGGEESMCGWLKDRFGFSWQVIPSNISELMNDPGRGNRVVEELMKMRKIELDVLMSA